MAFIKRFLVVATKRECMKSLARINFDSEVLSEKSSGRVMLKNMG